MQHPNRDPEVEPLQPREIEILNLIADGLSNREIAARLFLSPETVKWYNKQIFSKLGVNSRTQAIARARESNLFESQAKASGAEGHLKHNLPAQVTSFIGREKEIVEIKHLLKTSRLVVLTGPGGTGKTRLALRVAEDLYGNYRDGIWLVELAPLHQTNLVANELARVLHVNPNGDAPLTQSLSENLAQKQILLILDNFEHLLESAPLVSKLLTAAPRLMVLTTSREALHIYGEQEYPVHPLNLPDIQGEQTTRSMVASEAVDLFILRARAAKPDFSPNDAQMAAIAQICIRLDGLPLALELAATQVKIFPPAILNQRLQDSLHTLPGGPRDLPARQRTLHATIDWSYALLNEPEKLLFTRLAVFKGGALLEEIEQVCDWQASGQVVDLITSLTDKNLIQIRTGAEEEPRFWMLETIREYALEHLTAENEIESMQRRHALYFTELVETAEKEIRYARQGYWYKRLRAELDNLRSALTWSFTGGEPGFGIRIAAALGDFWWYSGLWVEGRHWIAHALELANNTSLEPRAHLYKTAGWCPFVFADPNKGKDLLLQALEIYRQLGDERNVAWCLFFLSNDPASGQEALALFRQLGDKAGIAHALNSFGEYYRFHGDYETADRCYEESLEIVKETGERIREAMLLDNMAYDAYHRQRYQDALNLTRQAILIYQELQNNYQLAGGIGIIAGPIGASGDPLRAARLLGASRLLLNELTQTNKSYYYTDQAEIDLFTETIRGQLGEKAFLEAYRAGQALSLSEAVALALENFS